MSPDEPGVTGSPRLGAVPPRRDPTDADASDLARGAGVNYLGYIARLGSRVPFLFLAGLLYGESLFGTFTFAITVVETAAAMSLFGMKRSLFKFLSDEMAETGTPYQTISQGVSLAVALGTIALLAVAAASGFLAQAFGLPSAGVALRVLSPAILFIVVSDILLVAIRFTRQMRFEVYARSIAEPLTLTVTIVVAYLAGAKEYGLEIGYVASLFVAAAMTVAFFLRVYPGVYRRLPRPRWREMRRLLTFSAPTAGYDLLLMLLDRVDIFVISYLMPAPVVGLYGMARQFSTATKKIRQGFDRILAPVLSDAIARGDREGAEGQMVLTTRWILTVQLPMVVFFAFWGGDVLGLLGGGFAAAATVLVLLMIADAINGSVGVCEYALIFLRPTANVFIGAGMLAVGIAANFWLIGAYGLEGAGLAVLVTVTIGNVVRILANRALLRLRVVALRILKPVLAAGASAALVWLAGQVLPPLGILGAVPGVPLLLGAYVGTLALLRFEPEDRAQVVRVRRALAAVSASVRSSRKSDARS